MTASPFIEQADVPHLDVPPIAVREASEFIACSCYSVIEYFANVYPDPGIRRGTIRMSLDDLRNTFVIDEGGWRPKQVTLTQLSDQVNTVKFSLDSWPHSAPKSLLEIAQEHVNRNCPLIAYIDGYQLHHESDEPGPIYAAVIAGVGDAESIVVDPWQGIKLTIDNPKLETIWDPELHQIIRIQPTVAPGKPGEDQ